MNAIRCCLAVIAGCAAGVLIAEVLLGLGPRDGGICIAIIAACVLLRGLVRAVQADREKDRARRRAYRDAVWNRRIHETQQRKREAA